MGWFQSLTTLATCVLLLQQTQVQAVPLNTPKALLKRGNGLSGKFLHVTDIHLDPYYKEGADPKKYCHSHGKKRSKEAGKYGALGTDCDSPQALVDATFKFLKNQINDIDFIIYTGDTVRHDRDNDLPRTQDEVIEGHQSIMKYFQSAYNTKNTPLIPTIGNNDAFVHNDVTIKDKIFGKLESIWKPLDLNLTDSFSNGGYFVQDVIKDQLSIVNLNSMYFFEKNDAAGDCDDSSSSAAIQMKWLESTLKSYQSKGGDHQVYIMSHVPPINDDGSSLYKSKCYSSYLNLLGEYSSVIAGHFTGHTNDDNMNAIVPSGKDSYTFIGAGDSKAQKSSLSKTALGLFNGPSVIPVNNPAVRVYTYDTGSGKYPFGTVRDWNQYYIDLNKANDGGSVDYQLEYTASELYGVDHFDGAGVGQAVINIANDKKANSLYAKYAKVSSK